MSLLDNIPLIGQGIQAATGIAQTISGISNRRRAENAYNSLPKLDYTESLAYKNARLNENIAARQANQGLEPETLSYYTDQSNRALASGLNSIGSLRSGISGVGSLAGSVLEGNRRIATMDAEQRIRNRDEWMRQRDNLVAQGKTAFDYEMGYDMLERARYLSEMSAARQQVNEGLSNIAGGVSGGLSELIE